MKKLKAFGLWFLLIFFSSCATQSRIIVDDGEGKSGQTMHLTQHIKAKTADQANGQATGIRFVTQYYFCPDKARKKVITMNVILRKPAAVGSPFDWKLDGETFGFEINDSSTTNEKSSPTNWQLQIPRSIWISIDNSDSIGFRLNVGKTEYQTELPTKFKKRLKYFLELAMDETDETPLVPEGKMKW